MELTPEQLSLALVQARGQQPLAQIAPPAGAGATRECLVSFNPVKDQLTVCITATEPRAQFAILTALLGNASIGDLCRDGVAFEVHLWRRRAGGGHVCEVIPLALEDFARYAHSSTSGVFH